MYTEKYKVINYVLDGLPLWVNDELFSDFDDALNLMYSENKKTLTKCEVQTLSGRVMCVVGDGE